MPITLIATTQTNEQVDVYPIALTYYDEETGEAIEKIIYMSVVTINTIISMENAEGIDAFDAIVSQGTMENITDTALIEITQARAWDIETGGTIPIHVSHVTQIFGKKQTYEVTFSTTKNTQIVVQIIEQETVTLQVESSYLAPTNVWEKSSKYFLTFIVFIIVLPIILLIMMFFLSQNKIKKMQKLLFEK